MRPKNIVLHLGCATLIALMTASNLAAVPLFQPPQTYVSGGQGADSIAVADLNGDGKKDLIVSNLIGGTVAVLLANGDGTFQPAKIIVSGITFAISVVVADVNGDGKPDVLVSSSGSCPPEACLNYVYVLLGMGDGTFGAPHTYAEGYDVVRIAVADVNGDGKPDVLVANGYADPNFIGDGALTVLLGNGDGSFGAGQLYDSGDRAVTAIAVGDLNGDGSPDIVLVHEDGVIGVLLGNGDGTFKALQTYVSGGHLAYFVAIADVNADGKPDLLVSNNCVSDSCAAAGIGVLLGNGDGTFQTAQNSYTAGIGRATSFAVADINGDGRPDVIVAHNCGHQFCDSSTLSVLLGNGDGTFAKALIYHSGGRNADAIAAADVNGDSKPDLLVTNECVSFSDCTSGSIGVLIGNAGVKTTTSVSSSLNPSVYGQAVKLTATVTSVGSSTPTGTVRFQNGTLGLGSATLSGGVAALTKTNLPAGLLSITATYNGDANSAKSTSTPVNQMVEQASTTTTIKSSLNPSAQGQAVTFTANVTSPTAHVTGSVRFTSGSTTLGTVTVSGGKASLTTSALPKGSDHVRATYGGTVNIVGSAASLIQTVN